MAVSMIGPKFYAFDREGKPLAFGKVYTYKARTNEPKSTYQSEDGIVANTNPVILNGEGYGNIYLDGSYKIVVKDKDDNEIWTADPVSASTAEEWVNCMTATYLTSTTFKISGNVTDKFEAGRRIRIDNNAATYGYSTILSAVFAATDTTVTIADPVVTTGLINACVSIVGSQSLAGSNVKNVTQLRATEPETSGQLLNSSGHTNEGVGGGDFYAILNDAGSDNNGTKFKTPLGHSWNRVDANLATAEDFGFIVGSSDMTAILQNYADFASTESKLFQLPEGIVTTDSITFENAAGLTFKGAGAFATQIRPFTALGSSSLLKFLPKDAVSGAAITGLSVHDFTIQASGYAGPLIDISSAFDSVVLQKIRCDKFAHNALRFAPQDASRPLAYNFIEGVIIKDSVFIGDIKADFPTTVPIIEFLSGNEVTIHDTKVYISRTTSATVNSQADLDVTQSRSALKMGGTTRGWDIHNFTCTVAMNTRVIDINDGKGHRIHAFFERIGEFESGGLPTTSDSNLIYWEQAGGLNQINGGEIICNRVEFPITLRKSIVLNNCARVSYSGSAFSPSDFDLSTADDCYIVCNRDAKSETERGTSEIERNTVVNITGSITQFANKLSVRKRTDTGSKDENASFPTFEWDQGLDSLDVQRGKVMAELTSTSASLENSRLDFTTGVGGSNEQVALSLYRGGIVIGIYPGVPSLNGFNDPGPGGVVFDTVGDRFLFRDSVGFKTPTMSVA